MTFMAWSPIKIMEGRTHYERIVGGTPEEKKAASEELQSFFEEPDERLAEYEIEKTPEDLRILNATESLVNRIVSHYGGDPKPLPLEHIYILKPGSVSAMTGGNLAGGIHKPFGLKIGVEKEGSKLLLASVVAHELFHLKSYKSARVGKSGDGALLYRSGLSMIDTKDSGAEAGEEREYFAVLEEAIVVECTKKFLDEISQDAEFSEEAQAVRKFKDWVAAYYRRPGNPEEKAKVLERELKYITGPQDKVEQVLAFSDEEESRQTYAAEMLRSLYEEGKIEMMERYEEREKLYKLLDMLVEKSSGKFKGRDEVFDEFAKANFSGNYLPLARMVEGILGKGSFRKLAEEFAREPEKEDPENPQE